MCFLVWSVFVSHATGWTCFVESAEKLFHYEVLPKFNYVIWTCYAGVTSNSTSFESTSKIHFSPFIEVSKHFNERNVCPLKSGSFITKIIRPPLVLSIVYGDEQRSFLEDFLSLVVLQYLDHCDFSPFGRGFRTNHCLSLHVWEMDSSSILEIQFGNYSGMMPISAHQMLPGLLAVSKYLD